MELKIKELSRVYGTGEAEVTALQSCSLHFAEGERAAIIGASGSGKSTLLHLLGGLDTPTAGEVFFDGQELYQMKENARSVFRRRNIGFVFQAYNLIPELSARENILLPLMLDSKHADSTFFQKVTQVLGIEDRLKHLPGELSGGQQQRVAIARAVICKPALLLCDEPTGNLDSRSGEEVMDLLLSLSQECCITLLVVTHDKEVSRRFPRVITIADGQVGGDVE